MKFPKRLITHDGAAGELARRVLLESDFGAPPPSASQMVWSGLGAHLVSPTGPGADGGQLVQQAGPRLPASTLLKAASIHTSGTGVALLKAGALVSVVAAGGLTILTLQRTPPAPATRSVATAIIQQGRLPRSTPIEETVPNAATSVAEVVESAPSDVLPATTAKSPPRVPVYIGHPAPRASDEPEPRASANPPTPDVSSALGPAVTVTPHESTKVDHQSAQAEVKRSQLMRETALLEQGRAALRAGNPGQAWRVLEQWAAEFPEGQLAQEREVLHIELLWRSGRRDLAAERIRAFISEHPGSAHAARLRSLLPESE